MGFSQGRPATLPEKPRTRAKRVRGSTDHGFTPLALAVAVAPVVIVAIAVVMVVVVIVAVP
jgi:hypothetical protein